LKAEPKQFQLLIVDDEMGTRQLLAEILKEDGYSIVTASNGQEALYAVERHRPDLILLDWQMPIMSGMQVCKRLRESGNHTPIIFVTARSQEVDEVQAYMLGADDYLTKPITRTRLQVHVAARLRRPNPDPEPPPLPSHRWGPFVVDESRREATLEGKALRLSPSEFKILTLLVRGQGRVVERELILDRLWENGGTAFATRTIDLHISHLRDKIDRLGAPRTLIETVRGIGYKLQDHDRDGADRRLSAN
jgi:DNA-binding response OmpR family regulator